jgi:hypothetical protein
MEELKQGVSSRWKHGKELKEECHAEELKQAVSSRWKHGGTRAESANQKETKEELRCEV